MKLHVVSVEKKETHEVAWVKVETDIGSFVVQLGHAPMVLTLAPEKRLSFRLKSGKQEYIVISRGVIEVDRESATVLIL